VRGCQARSLSRKTSSMKHGIDGLRKRIYFRADGTPKNMRNGRRREKFPPLYILLKFQRADVLRGAMSFVAYCFICEKKVTAHTLLDAAKLLVALANHYDVEVMHTSDSGDHRWKLNREERARLLNHIRKSMYNN
jgi:hypothetical protein